MKTCKKARNPICTVLVDVCCFVLLCGSQGVGPSGTRPFLAADLLEEPARWEQTTENGKVLNYCILLLKDGERYDR